MAMRYSGGCACGRVRYGTDAEPIFQNHCQCLDCRKRSGTGHSSYLTFGRRDEMQITGEVTTWRLAGDSGKEKSHAFCPTCGTPVFLTFPAMPELIAVHAGSLDDAEMFAPTVLTYAMRGLSWDAMDMRLTHFAKMAG